jgi:dCTP deaminase
MNHHGILTREDIVEAQRARQLLIDPFTESHLQPTSYDISVSHVLDGDGRIQDFDSVEVGHLEFMNFVSEELLAFPLDMIGHIYLRSTFARKGIGIIHLGRIEAGWKGRLVIEVLNAKSPLIIKRGERIATVEFIRLARPVSSPYEGKFQGFGV